MMRFVAGAFSLGGSAVLLLASSVAAGSPPEELAREITELRERVGERGQVVADQAEFRDAVQRQFAVPPQRTNEAWRAWPADRMPPQPPGVPHRPPGQDRNVLLRESAFELDRIAHSLEMAQLFGEADELRGAADSLRKSARKPDKRNHDGHEGHERHKERSAVSDRGPAEPTAGMMKRFEEERATLARQAAELRRTLENRLEAAQREQEETARRVQRLVEQVRRQAAEATPAPAPAQPVPPAPPLPPAGVHGGPTEPEPAAGRP